MKFSEFLSVLVAAAGSASALTIGLGFSNGDQSLIAGLPYNGQPIPGGSPITYCNEGSYNPKNDLVNIKRIAIDPNPPAAGKTLNLQVSGYVKERIEEGAYLDVIVKLGYIQLIKKRFDFCDLLTQADVDVSCPVEPGELNIVKDQELPKEIPPGKFIVTAHLYTVDDVLVTCLHTEVSFTH